MRELRLNIMFQNIMNNINFPDDDYDFNDLTLANPIVLQQQQYFTKMQHKGSDILIQMPKCYSKQGFMTSSKRQYCDLMIPCENKTILSWVEKLEERLRGLIFERRKNWFHEDVDLDDIDNIFTSPLRSFNSGKYFLLRTMLQSPRMLQSDQISIFDENENPLNKEDVGNKTEFVSILHFHGIKFSSTSFQVYIEMKQMMVMNVEKTFSKCMINTKVNVVDNIPKDIELSKNVYEDIVATDVELSDTISESNTKSNTKSNTAADDDAIESLGILNINESLPLELEEVYLEPTIDGILQLKNKDDVYIKAYRKAKDKAKRLRISALKTLLKAKNIKDKYLLNNMELSDDDEDDNTTINTSDLESTTDTLETLSDDEDDDYNINDENIEYNESN